MNPSAYAGYAQTMIVSRVWIGMMERPPGTEPRLHAPDRCALPMAVSTFEEEMRSPSGGFIASVAFLAVIAAAFIYVIHEHFVSHTVSYDELKELF